MALETHQIDAARLGDRHAQAELLRSLQDPWYRLCLGLLRDPDKAQDAVQETALRFLKQIRQFRGDSKLTTWSMGIAINVVREMRRRRILGTGGEDDMLEQMPAASAAAPLDAAASTEQRAALRLILDQLPQRQREAVILRFFEDLSVEDTAAAMNCAEGTVKATIHQALRALKRKLEQIS